MTKWFNGKKIFKKDVLTSFPTGIPLPRPAVRPTTFATKALRVRYSFRTTPLRMVFSSGIPEPTGSRVWREDTDRKWKRRQRTGRTRESALPMACGDTR